MQLLHLIQSINWSDVASTFLLALSGLVALAAIGYVCYAIIDAIGIITSEKLDGPLPNPSEIERDEREAA